MADTTDRTVEDLVEELLRTGLMLTDLFADLLEGLPDGAFPGEDHADVLLEMFAGSLRPVAAAYGDRMVRETTALIGAAGDRILDDLREASLLARERDAGEG